MRVGFRLNIRKRFFTVNMVRHWSSLTREVVDASSPGVFKARLDGSLSFSGRCLCSWQGQWNYIVFRALHTQTMLWFCVSNKSLRGYISLVIQKYTGCRYLLKNLKSLLNNSVLKCLNASLFYGVFLLLLRTKIQTDERSFSIMDLIYQYFFLEYLAFSHCAD